jgi:hypothetical protein
VHKDYQDRLYLEPGAVPPRFTIVQAAHFHHFLQFSLTVKEKSPPITGSSCVAEYLRIFQSEKQMMSTPATESAFESFLINNCARTDSIGKTFRECVFVGWDGRTRLVHVGVTGRWRFWGLDSHEARFNIEKSMALAASTDAHYQSQYYTTHLNEWARLCSGYG